MRVNWVFLLLIAGSIFFQMCHYKSDKSDLEGAAVVSVTVLPLQYFTERICGDFCRVNVLVPPGAGHSTYEPTAKQMKKLSRSQLYLSIPSLDFEHAWMGRFRSVNPQIEVVDISRGISLIGNSRHDNGQDHTVCDHGVPGHGDPHIWVSPSTVLPLIENIRQALVRVYPDEEEVFNANYQRLKAEVYAKDSLLKDRFSSLVDRSFLVYHPALGYLARDYNLEQIVIEDMGREPSPRQLGKVLRQAHEKGVDKLFVQKQFDVETSRVVAGELGLKVVIIDPLDYNWNSQIEHIANSVGDDKIVGGK